MRPSAFAAEACSAAGRSCATAPMLPAPIVSTTSPSRAMPASTCGSSSSDSSSTGSTAPRDAHRAAERPAVGAGDRRLARRIDLGDQQRVGRRQHLREVVEQVAGARVAVRLEHQHQAALRPGLAHGLERRGDLGRVVAVVVDERDAAARSLDVAEHLQAPVDALEARQRALDGRVGDLELRGHGDGGQRVEHVVQARQVQRDRQRVFGTRTQHVECRLRTAARDVDGAHVGAFAQAVGDVRAARPAESARPPRGRRRTAPPARRTAGCAGTRRSSP